MTIRKRKSEIVVVNRNEVPMFITKDRSIIREILAYRNSNIKKQSLAEATVLPGEETEEHYHKKSEEIYYILLGNGSVFLNGKRRKIRKGDGIAIPPKTRHKIRNTGRKSLVFLCCCAPCYEHKDAVVVRKKKKYKPT